MTSPLPLDPTADERASLWAARLDGGILSADDRAALDAWLAEHPQHRQLLSAYCQLSSDLERDLPRLAEAADLPYRSTGSTATGRHRRRRAWPILAAAAAVALILFVALPQPSTEQSDSFATTVAQRQERNLADGSRIQLNAHTAMAVAFTAQERRVRLASGQAFFDVASDPHRPFIVETPAGAVRVTGTKFDVRCEGSSPLEVVVLEGSVQVREGSRSEDTAASVALVAGNHYIGGPQPTVRDLSPAALENALAWRRGQIVFEGSPLRDVLSRFARYHGRGLSASNAAGQLSIGGRYSLDDLEGFLGALEDIHPVEVVQNLSGTVHVRLRSEAPAP
jgi:transmembrane sensor